MNRKIMIELIIYAVLVIVGLILLFTSNSNTHNKKNDLHNGGAGHAIIFVQ